MSKFTNLESSSTVFNISLVGDDPLLLPVNPNLPATSFVKSVASEPVSRKVLV